MTRWLIGARRYAEPTLLVLFCLAGWEYASRSGLLSPADFPPVSAIALQMAADLQNPNLWHGIQLTMLAWALGLALVIATAVPLGLLFASSRVMYSATHVLIEFMRTIPGVAALPLLIFMYGVGFQLTLMLIVITAFWPLLIQVMAGAHDVDSVARDTGRVYGLGRLQIFRQIVLYSAAPYIATGIRLSGTVALIIAVATSLIAGGDGLGALIGSAAESAQIALMYGRILVAGVLGLLVTGVLVAIERRALHWHPSQRRTQA